MCGLAKLSKKERKSGYLILSIEKVGGKLTPEAKRRLALKNGGFRECKVCGCPKMVRRYPRPGKRSGLYCYNCGWVG